MSDCDTTVAVATTDSNMMADVAADARM